MNCQKCWGTDEWVSPVSRYGCPSRCPECSGVGVVLDREIPKPVAVVPDREPSKSAATVRREMDSWECGECWWCGAEPEHQCDRSLHMQVGHPVPDGDAVLPVVGDHGVCKENAIGSASHRALARRVRVAHQALSDLVFGYPSTLENAIARVRQDLDQADVENASLRKRVSDLEQELREFAIAVSEHDCRAQRAAEVTAVTSPSGRRKRETGSTAEIPIQNMAKQVFGQEKGQE